MRNIESSLVFCDVAMLMANIKLSYRPLYYLTPNTQDFRHQVIWCKQVSAMWVMVPVPFMEQRMAVFLHLELLFPRVFPWMRKPGWSTSWLKYCRAWRCLSLLVFMPDADWWWICVRQHWHLPLGNWLRKGRETWRWDRVRCQRQADRGRQSRVRRMSLTQTPVWAKIVQILNKSWVEFFKGRHVPAAKVLLCWIWTDSLYKWNTSSILILCIDPFFSRCHMESLGNISHNEIHYIFWRA